MKYYLILEGETCSYEKDGSTYQYDTFDEIRQHLKLIDEVAEFHDTKEAREHYGEDRWEEIYDYISFLVSDASNVIGYLTSHQIIFGEEVSLKEED